MAARMANELNFWVCLIIVHQIWTKIFYYLIKSIFNLKYYHIKLILMLIVCNYDACYHSFINFPHWHAILLKFIFFTLFRVNYVFY